MRPGKHKRKYELINEKEKGRRDTHGLTRI